jgi:hypothetical protein
MNYTFSDNILTEISDYNQNELINTMIIDEFYENIKFKVIDESNFFIKKVQRKTKKFQLKRNIFRKT